MLGDRRTNIMFNLLTYALISVLFGLMLGKQNSMAEVKNASEKKVVFIGKAWKNTTKNGKEYVSLSIDRGMELTFHPGDAIELWPNSKRTGINPRTNKEYQDADFRASIRIPAVNA